MFGGEATSILTQGDVADLVGQGRCLYYDVPDETLRELRSLISFRTRQKKEEHALWMRLRNNVFAQFFPELGKEGDGKEGDAHKFISFLFGALKIDALAQT